MGDQTWRQLLAIGVVAGSLDARTIARHAAVSVPEAQDALDRAEAEGVLVGGAVDATTEAVLLAELPRQSIAEIHAAVARHLMTSGSRNVAAAVEHAYAAGHLLPLEELVELAEHRGEVCLGLGDYEGAQMLLEFARDMDIAPPPARQARRLQHLAAAHHGLGRVVEAREFVTQAFNLALLVDDTDLAVDLAVMYTFPVDWYAGDGRATALLQQCTTLDLTEDHQVLVNAARALAEMRMPLPGQSQHQMAWITRPTVAQPLAESALNGSLNASPRARLVALLAWRNTHRAPDYLALRREYSSEALDLAQTLRDPYAQIDAAGMLAVDALQSADRPLFDKALTVARWVADRVGNPRLSWQVNTMAAGAALLDGDTDLADSYREEAARLGRLIAAPGWLGADMFLRAEILVERDELNLMAPWLDNREEGPVLNPIGKITMALVAFRAGRADMAETLLRQALRQIDPEASILLLGTRAVEVALLLDVPDVVQQLIGVLEPWADQVSVDSHAWWCDGPVAVRLAQLHLAAGRPDLAGPLLERGIAMAHDINDVRSLKRTSAIRDSIERSAMAMVGPEGHPGGATDRSGMLTVPDGSQLTSRELEVLALMTRGLTNSAIARELAYSLSTIRLDTMSIYRKLGVQGRVEAVALVIGARPDDVHMAP